MQPANLVVIMSDEHHPAPWPLRHPFAITPNLNRLAARGTRFDAAYCNSPICVPSRASFATGRYVHELGTWDNAIAYDGRIQGWGHALQRSGHRVDSIGKLHYRNAEDPTGFDHQYHPMHIYGGHGMVWGALRDGKADFTERAHVMLYPIGPGTSKYNIYDDRIATEAETWIARVAGEKHDRPWVLFVGFVAPHFPLTVPKEFFDLYPVDKMPLSRLHPKDGYPRPPWLEASHQIPPVDDALDDRRRRLATACYYGLCTWVDRQVGRVIAALERTRLGETTRVVYTSDHGDNLGARGLWGKSTLYEESAGVPLIMAGPEIPAGEVVATPVSQSTSRPQSWRPSARTPTAGPTICRDGRCSTLGANLTIPSARYSRSTTRSARRRRPSCSKRALTGVRYYVGYEPELFDLAADPGEERNLRRFGPCHHRVCFRSRAAQNSRS